MKNPTHVPIGLLAALLCLTEAGAHHSSSGYAQDQTVTIDGAVTRYEWSNPHVYIYVEQRTDSGEKIEWQIEGSPPSIMRRLGWSKDTLHTGDAITVSGHPNLKEGNKGLLPVTIARGNVSLFDRKSELPQLQSAEVVAGSRPKGLEGTWVTLLAPEVVGRLEEPEKLQLTPEGTAAFKRFDEKTMHPGVNCVPFTAPIIMLTPDLKRIVRGDGVILIAGEFDGAQRTIHMNVATHEGALLSTQGHSIGRWEGPALVIDTTQFAYHSLGNAYGLPSGPRKHLLERLTPSADGKSLTYHFELSDPEYLAAPVSGEVRWTYRPDQKFAPLPCDPENARRFLKD